MAELDEWQDPLRNGEPSDGGLGRSDDRFLQRDRWMQDRGRLGQELRRTGFGYDDDLEAETEPDLYGWIGRLSPRSVGMDTSRNFRGKGPKGYVRADERILEDVCETLTEDPDVDASDLEVSVAHGEVTLQGTVEDRWQKRMAENAAERCRGVKDVHNQIRLRA